MQPLVLPPNQLHRFYRGGERIAALRGTGSDDPYAPEEWIASMASPFGEPGIGISSLGDGRSVAEAIADDPEAYLGRAHIDRFGADVAVLIKLLDAGERLPVHLHPDDAFAKKHLGSARGKTEAWIVVDADPGADVYVGFRDEVTRDALVKWVESQDASEMLGALHRVPVRRGDTVFVPAGTPHAIGEGVLIAELQQPTDFSILLEWEGFAIDGPTAGHLGLGFDIALDAIDMTPWTADDLARARANRPGARSEVQTLFPAAADPFFRAERIRPAPTALEQAFSVLLVNAGAAALSGERWTLDIARGDAVLVPHAAGECTLDGGAEVLRCMPPDPALV